MDSAGPSALPSMSFAEEDECKKLQQLVRGQVELLANDCGWVPPVFDKGNTQELEEKEEQEDIDFKIKP